jgi:hypothetical protein
LFGEDAVVGITANNNPTVQDLWHTTPAWSFPYFSSDLAPSPAASTLLEGPLAQQVAGVGAYGLWNDLVYIELTGYWGLPSRWRRSLGVASADDPQAGLDGAVPYWRLGVQRDWGGHYAMLGTFGAVAHVFPDSDSSAGSDEVTDVAVDAQYEFTGSEHHSLALYATYIHEHQSLAASRVLGLAANGSDTLESLRTHASYFFDQTYGFTAGYFRIWGSADAGLHASGDAIAGSANGRPDSSGYTLELDYVPFGKDDSPLAPNVNLRLALQYTGYLTFNGGGSNYDGLGRDASDNNTLLFLGWLAF